MTKARRLLGVASGVAVLGFLVACGGVQRDAQDGMELLELAGSYKAFHNDPKNKGKGPADAEEWAAWAQATPGQQAYVELIRQCKPGGRFTFFWGVNFAGLPAKTVLGHDNRLPAGRGFAVTADGVPRMMEPAAFAAAPRPPKDAGNEKKSEKPID